MEYALYNFKIYQGVDKYIPFIFYSLNNDQKVYDNFTGTNIVMTIKSSYNDNIIDQLTTENNRIKLGILNSSNEFEESTNNPYAIEIYFPHSITKNFNIPNMVYDLFKINDNNYELLLYGNISIIQGVNNEYSSTN